MVFAPNRESAPMKRGNVRAIDPLARPGFPVTGARQRSASGMRSGFPGACIEDRPRQSISEGPPVLQDLKGLCIGPAAAALPARM